MSRQYPQQTIDRYTEHVQSKCRAETGKTVEALSEDAVRRVFANVVMPETMTELALLVRRQMLRGRR